jgi:hypothetical protein
MSLVATLMQDLRSQYAGQLDKNELRESRYGALRLFQQDAQSADSILDPETVSNISKSFNRDVIVPVLDAQTIASTTPFTRSCVINDSENESALVALTFATYGFSFSMTPSLYVENDVNYQRDFNRKMMKYIIQLSADLDTACIAQLEADKNIFWTNLTAFYAQVANAMQVPQVDKNDTWNKVESIMQTADFYKQMNIVHSTTVDPTVRRLMNQGAGNSINEGFQFDLGGGYNFFGSNRVANAGGVEGTFYAVEAGNTGIYNRLDPDARLGSSIGEVSQWGNEMLPLVGMDFGTYYTQNCADQSAIGGAASAGLTRARREGFAFDSDVVLLSSYNSSRATRYNPIVKFEILS